jgi:hypothetical protein
MLDPNKSRQRLVPLTSSARGSLLRYLLVAISYALRSYFWRDER